MNGQGIKGRGCRLGSQKQRNCQQNDAVYPQSDKYSMSHIGFLKIRTVHEESLKQPNKRQHEPNNLFLFYSASRLARILIPGLGIKPM